MLAGLAWLYLLPPVPPRRVAALAAGAGPGPVAGTVAVWCAAAGLTGWFLQAVTYLPVLKLYQLSWLRAFGLPLAALLYAGMTADSALRYHAGRGGAWKGRTIPL